MSDGLNQVRAMRIAEIMQDFRHIQTYMASIRIRTHSEDYNEDGYVLLRRCIAEAQALLQQPFRGGESGRGSEEEKRGELRRIILDASIRRFRAQKIYLRAVAALRWVNARQAVLKGQRPQPGHAAALAQVRAQLRAELTAITDSRVELSLRQPDEQAEKWLDEDPGLGLIQRLIGAGNGGVR